MLLTEIKRLPLPTSSKTVTVSKPRNMTSIGAGIQSFVYANENKPDRVVKLTLAADNDAYEAFLKLILHHQDNPFLPKIYAVKKYRIDTISPDEYIELKRLLTSMGSTSMDEKELRRVKWLLIVVTERLVPIRQADRDELTQSLKKLYGPEGLKLCRTQWSDCNIIYPLTKPNLLNELVRLTPNWQFRKAIRLVRLLFKKYAEDIHKENIMFRQTPTGLQLVFNDPVWNRYD